MTWQRTTWGELATLEYGKALRGYENASGNVRVYGTNGPIGWHNTAMHDGPGVIVGRKGAYRGVHFSHGPFFAIDTAFYLSPKVDLDIRWAYYELLTHDLNSMDSGSAIPSTSRDAFYHMPVHVPPLDVQAAIADHLAMIDVKIEANRRVSLTLQSIAKAVFQSWFIDFDPVRAKLSGEQTESITSRLGLPAQGVSLFPDKFDDSAPERIPTGWVTSTLGEQAKAWGGMIQTGPFGSQLHASDYVENGVPVVMPQDLQDRRISIERIARVSAETAEGLRRHALRAGDVVYSRRGDVERHALVSAREEGWLCGTGCLLVRLGDRWPSQAYLSEVLNDARTRAWIVQHAVGATMPNLNTAILSAVPILMPPIALLEAYEAVVSPLRRQQEALSNQVESLTTLREQLLPRLLSGELVPMSQRD